MLVTLFLAARLYRVYRSTSRRFYIYWTLGYTFYGLNILIRIFSPESTEITVSSLLAFFIAMTGFMFMVIGVGELIKKKRVLIITSFMLLLLPILQSFAGQEFVPVSLAFAIIPYLFMTSSLLLISWRSDVDLKLLSSGWWILFLANLGSMTDQIETGFVDLISTVGKIIIYWGMTHPSFSFVVENLYTFMLGGSAPEYLGNTQGTLTLVNLDNVQKDKNIQWIKNRIDGNVKKGMRTIFITLYDLIIPEEIIEIKTSDDLYFVRVLPGIRELSKVFEEKISVINDDLFQLDILISDILNFSSETRAPCEIIIYTFSHLIHRHGWKRIYAFITSKNPLLKSSMVELTGFYSPASHENSSDIVTFETMADRVVNQ